MKNQEVVFFKLWVALAVFAGTHGVGAAAHFHIFNTTKTLRTYPEFPMTISPIFDATVCGYRKFSIYRNFGPSREPPKKASPPCIFHFSCDELVLKLKGETAHTKAK